MFDVGVVLAATPVDVVVVSVVSSSDDTQSTETTNVATSEKVAVKTETKQTADVSDAFDELFNS